MGVPAIHVDRQWEVLKGIQVGLDNPACPDIWVGLAGILVVPGNPAHILLLQAVHGIPDNQVLLGRLVLQVLLGTLVLILYTVT